MKKSIQTLASKLEITDTGKIRGGFATIKGGSTSLSRLANNATQCDNKATCGGNNQNICTNGVNCSDSTNAAECTNSTTCFGL